MRKFHRIIKDFERKTGLADVIEEGKKVKLKIKIKTMDEQTASEIMELIEQALDHVSPDTYTMDWEMK